ncbi:Mov34/MPN/PAD-1 family protein [Synechocystis sp. PCC 7509]|uniref:Mov34/MPN/PAD-1 family protein n=1 Tax=Synechocystis sp. PCC 7509 TaxID=927677 RepID=UPI0002ACC620|nr:Mov34/MPN/PAD-1 family protein [Synechocystis sp. PCC 7509]
MADLEFWSLDKKFGISIAEKRLSQLLKMCVHSGTNETGGILVGFYTELHTCAVVTAISSPPSDSSSGSNWFNRGTQGLEGWLHRLWHRDKHYYLGEWHFHPYASPKASQIDIEQMNQIASSPLYQCPEPLLLIIGGSSVNEWNAKAYVFLQNTKFIELVR